jgi:hypothetical protein
MLAAPFERMSASGHIAAIAAMSLAEGKRPGGLPGPSLFTTRSHQRFVIMLRPREQQRP